MLFLAVDDFSIQVKDYPFHLVDKVNTRTKNTLKTIFAKFFKSTDEERKSLGRKKLDMIQQLINDQVLTYEQHTRLYNDTLEIDFQLVDEGIRVTDDYMAMVMDGTFHQVMMGWDYSQHESEYMSAMPFHNEERGAAQVMISDYTIQSLINSSLDLQWYDFEYKATGDDVNNYIKGFSQAFGTFSEVDITVRPVPDMQKVTFGGKRGISKFTGLIDIHV